MFFMKLIMTLLIACLVGCIDTEIGTSNINEVRDRANTHAVSKRYAKSMRLFQQIMESKFATLDDAVTYCEVAKASSAGPQQFNLCLEYLAKVQHFVDKDYVGRPSIRIVELRYFYMLLDLSAAGIGAWDYCDILRLAYKRNSYDFKLRDLYYSGRCQKK